MLSEIMTTLCVLLDLGTKMLPETVDNILVRGSNKIHVTLDPVTNVILFIVIFSGFELCLGQQSVPWGSGL